MNFNDIHYTFFELAYRDKIFDWMAQETTNEFGMA